MATSKRDKRDPSDRAPKRATEGWGEGYEELELGGANIDWRERDKLEARIVGTDSFTKNVTLQDGTPSAKVQRIFIVEAEGETQRLWETAGLRRLFDTARVGDTVKIAVTGVVDLAGGRHMRTFRAAIKPGARPGGSAPQPAPRRAPASGGPGDDIPF